MLNQVVIFCAVISLSSAYMAIMELDPIPEKYKGQEGCYLKKLDRVVPFGSTTPSKKGCFEYRCGSDSVDIAGCGSILVAPPCYLVTDKTKPYPECCPEPKCP